MAVAKVKYFSVVVPYNHEKTKILLGRKKRGLGEGLWNGFGGKPDAGETMDQCTSRELEEECGIRAEEMTCVGILYMDCTTGRNYHIPVYIATKYSGEPVETEEMKPKWYDASAEALPYENMHKEAKVWWPVMLSGKPFIARFLFEGENFSYNIQITDRQTIDQHIDSINKLL
ncbi:Nudix (Nucleoside diphosphate linked moiety X)-type motif 1 [Coemansia sp. RSA 485]|nr:Nudix (Nucleoside diphosphate linked moiety X)-type motif 1 [Coemansia sp. RSA 485]